MVLHLALHLQVSSQEHPRGRWNHCEGLCPGPVHTSGLCSALHGAALQRPPVHGP